MDFKQLITITQATKLIPGRPSFSTVWRWCTKGTRTAQGEVIRLRYVKIGRKIYTSKGWLSEYFIACAKVESEKYDGERKFNRSRKSISRKSQTNRDSEQQQAYEILRKNGIEV